MRALPPTRPPAPPHPYPERACSTSPCVRALVHTCTSARAHTRAAGRGGYARVRAPTPPTSPTPPRAHARASVPSPHPRLLPLRARACAGGRVSCVCLPPLPSYHQRAHARACLGGSVCILSRVLVRVLARVTAACALRPPPLLPARVYLNVWMVYLRSVSPIQFLLVGGDKIGNVPAHYLVHSVQVS